jgi:copper chaperone CopZ
MAQDVSQDQLVIIRIEGLHCHRCERTIQSTLMREEGVHEVEVDFLSGQASVLFDAEKVRVATLTELIQEAGYRATGFTRGGNE